MRGGAVCPTVTGSATRIEGLRCTATYVRTRLVSSAVRMPPTAAPATPPTAAPTGPPTTAPMTAPPAANKTKSIVLTEEGLQKAEELFKGCLRESPEPQAAAC